MRSCMSFPSKQELLQQTAPRYQEACAGYLEDLFLKTQRGEGRTEQMKGKKWPAVSACHAGLLADHRTPVGSG